MASSLDIIIAAPASATRLAECAQAVARQLPSDARTVTLTVAHASALPPALAQQFPRVHWIACESDATLPTLYGRALTETHGDWIALLDAECAVADGWLEVATDLSLRAPAALTAGARNDDLFGGAVEPHALHSRAAWAAYFVDYGVFMLPLAAGAASAVAGNNLVMRRALLARAPVFATPQFWKSHFVSALAAQGIAPKSAPSLVVTYAKNFPARVWFSRRFTHGRCFAALRVAHGSATTRSARALVAPIVPFVMGARLARDVWPKRRHRREFVLALPWIVAGLVAWACGEWMGTVCGAGTSCAEIF